MNHFKKIGGVASLILAACYLVGFAVYGFILDYGSVVEALEKVALFADNQATLYVTTLFVYVLFGFFLVIERLGLDRVLKSTWTPVQHLYLILIYLLTLIFFRVAEFPDAVTFLAIMLGIGDQGSLSWLEFYTRGAVLTIILGVVISTPFYPWLCRKVIPLLHQNSPQHMLCQFILIFGLLLVSVMGIATNAYTPFIYFRF